MAIIVSRATTALTSGTGTITTSTSSTTVTGVSTLFTTEVDYAGKALYTSGDVYIGTVSSITNNTTIVLTANAAVAVSGGAYKIGYLPKNAPLSNLEIDTNFINLNNNKLEITDTTAVNIANSVVRRDGSGNFAAGQITATSVTQGKSDTSNNIATTAYVRNLFRADSTSGTLDWNDVSNTRPGAAATLLLGTATNGMGGSNYYIPFNVEYSSNDGTGNVTQMGIAYGSPGNELYMRGRYSGTWSSWVRYLNSSNYNDYAPTKTGTGASGSWGISVTGSAATLVTSNSYQVGSLGVGTAASGTTGEIRATNAITSYYSDSRLKENIVVIENALDKIVQLDGVTYNANKLAESFGFTNKEKQVGVLADQVAKVLPEAVKPAPFDIIRIDENTEISRSGENYKTVQYEKLVPLLIQAIKELKEEVDTLKGSK